MSPKESAPEEEVLVSGGIDDIVRVWTYRQGELSLKHQLTDHSLGVSNEQHTFLSHIFWHIFLVWL